MRWGDDAVGMVLSRNEIWMLLNALAIAPVPSVDRDGNRLEPWVIGELTGRLQMAMSPDPLSDVEDRPVIRMDSDMGQSLGAAGIEPLVIEDGFEIGSLLAACAERGWGATLCLPAGSTKETPAEATVHVPAGTSGNPEPPTGGRQAETLSGEADFRGLERPVVALARALLGALETTGNHTELDWGAAPSDSGRRAYEEYVMFSDAIAPGERQIAQARMEDQGWELAMDDGRQLVFRRRLNEG